MKNEMPVEERNMIHNLLENFFIKKEYNYLFNISLFLEHYIKKYPESKELVGWKIKLLVKTKKYSYAIKLCDELLKHDKKNSMIYFWKGTIYDLQRKKELAHKNFVIARKLNPTHDYTTEFPLIEKKIHKPYNMTVQELKVYTYFTTPEKLPEIDKQLCDMFMTCDPKTRNALKAAYPEMYNAFIKSERGVYKIIKCDDLIELSRT